MNDLIPADAAIEIREADYNGPMMMRLTKKQQDFVTHYIALGATPSIARKAAKAAGYPDSNVTGMSRQLLRNQNVIAALHEEGAKLVGAAAIEAVEVQLEILRTPEHKDRFKAAQFVMALNGMNPTQQISVKHDVTDDAKMMIAEIKAMCARRGIPPELMLPKGIIEGEYTEVDNG